MEVSGKRVEKIYADVKIQVRYEPQEQTEQFVSQVLRDALMTVVKARFPVIAEQAQEKVAAFDGSRALHMLIRQVSTAPSEEIARCVLLLPLA